MANEYDIIIRATDKTGKAFNSVEQKMNRINSAATGRGGFPAIALGLNGIAVGAVAAAAGVGNMASAMVRASTSLQQMQNRLSLTTNSTAELTAQMSRLRDLSAQNRTSFADTVQLYSNLKVATEDLGFSTSTVEELTTKLSQALAVAGADAATTSSVIRQFGQAMASGTVRGDEFNSLVEGLGPALSIMARESGITVGQLREMSQAGDLTAEKMAELLLNSNSLTEAFNKMEQTLPQVKQQMDDAFDKALADLAEYLKLNGLLEEFYKRNTRAAQEFSRALTGEEFLTYEQLNEELKTYQDRLVELQRIQDSFSLGDWALGLIPFAGKIINDVRDVQDEIEDTGIHITQLKKRMEELDAAGKGAGFTQLMKDVADLNAEFEAASARTQQFARDLTTLFQAPAGEALTNEAAILKTYTDAITAADEAIQAVATPTNEFTKAIQDQQTQVDATARAMHDLSEGFARARMMDQEGIDLIKMRELYNQRMNALLELQRRNVDALTLARTAEAQSIINSNSALHSQMYLESQAFTQKTQLLGRINQELQTNTYLTDEQRRALEDMRTTLENQIMGLDDAGIKLQTFNEYYKDLIQTSTEALNSQANMSQAVVQLTADFDAGIITITQYKNALEDLSSAGATLTLPQSVTLMQDRLQAMREEAELNPQIADQLRELNKASDDELRALGLIAPARRGSTRAKREELTASQELAKALGEQEARYKDLSATLANDNAIQELADKYGTSADRIRKALEEAQRAMTDFHTESVSITGIISETWDSMSKNMASSIANGIMEGKGAFNSFADFLKDFSKRIVTQILEKMLIQPMINQMTNWMGLSNTNVGGIFGGIVSGPGAGGAGMGLSGMLGGLWGGISNFFGGLWGGITSFFSGLPFFADGGYLPSGKMGIVGEAGPELITGPANITPMGETQAAPVINFNINAIDTQSGTEFIMKNKQQITGVIQDAYNRRGRQGVY